jgi:hypothetical protein
MKTRDNLDCDICDHCAILAQSSGVYHKALEYFVSHPKLIHNPAIHLQELAKQKADQIVWLSCLANTKRSHIKKLGFAYMKDFYKKALQLISEDARALGWKSWKCTSLLGLIKRLTPLKKAKNNTLLIVAFETVLSNKIGNENAIRLGTEQQSVILSLYSDPKRKFSFKKTFKIYTERAREMVRLEFWKEEESKISLSGLRGFLLKPKIKVQWYSKRD